MTEHEALERLAAIIDIVDVDGDVSWDTYWREIKKTLAEVRGEQGSRCLSSLSSETINGMANKLHGLTGLEPLIVCGSGGVVELQFEKAADGTMQVTPACLEKINASLRGQSG